MMKENMRGGILNINEAKKGSPRGGGVASLKTAVEKPRNVY